MRCFTSAHALVERESPGEFAEAFYLANTGRKGPVLVDIPKDVFMAKTAVPFPDKVERRGYHVPGPPPQEQVEKVAQLIRTSERPIIIAGAGVIHSEAYAELRTLAETAHIPVTNSLLGMGAFLAIFGTIITGTLSDYIGREVSAIMAYGFSIVGVICALFITSPTQGWLLWLHACLFGLTWGARGPAITAKTADLFPGAQLGAILGVITIGSGLGAALGSWGAGLIFDLSGSYELAFILSIVAYLCGVVAFWALRRPPVRRQI